MLTKIVVALILLNASQTAYYPELMLSAQPQFLNKLIANYSDPIINAINSYHIPDFPTVE